MKFTAATLFVSALTVGISISTANAADSATATGNSQSYTSDFIEGYDSTYDGGTMVYDGTCNEQANCLGMTVHEIQRRCGSGSCEFYVCYETEIGWTSADAWTAAAIESGIAAGTAGALAECKLNSDYGVDYAGNMHTDATFDDGGCLNTDNASGKGYWDETCIDPEVAAASTGISTTTTQQRFSTFCQVAYPGQTVHFMMHSYHGLDADGQTANAVSCSGTSSIGPEDGDEAKWGTTSCAPSSSSKSNANGQTYFPATDGTVGGTCSSEDEGEECVWSYTAPTNCAYEENYPACYITQDSVDTVNNLCGEDAGPVVEYFEHSNNPNGAPPRVPLHDIKHNGDGTVSFKMYNPYGNYAEPIDYTSNDHLYEGDDFHNMYIVYDQANEIGNEVCDLQTGAGKCATDEEYTAKCRSDGVSVVTVFASGFNSDSGAAQDITNAEGTDVFQCCPETYQPLDHYSKGQTAAWTFLVHCDCPDEIANLDRRQLKESISSKFQSGELFNENTKKLHNLM